MAIKILSDNQSAYLIKTETLTDQRKRKEKTVKHLSKQNNIFSQWINAAVLTLGVCGGESHHSNILNLDDDKSNKSGGGVFQSRNCGTADRVVASYTDETRVRKHPLSTFI